MHDGTMGSANTVITYIFECPGTHRIKLGQAKYYADRLAQLRNGSPIEPRPICAFLGSAKEHELHDRFAHLRVRGEFFHFTREIKDYLEAAPGKLSHKDALKISPRVQRARDLRGSKDLEMDNPLETDE